MNARYEEEPMVRLNALHEDYVRLAMQANLIVGGLDRATTTRLADMCLEMAGLHEQSAAELRSVAAIWQS